MRRLLTILVALLTACAAPGERGSETGAPPIPADSYLESARRGSSVFEILPAQSLLLIHVGRAGPAARLGHDHAVASENLSGFIELGRDAAESRADVAFPVRDLVVDKAAYRERLGLDTRPTGDDIAGTYGNMLKVLEPDLYPWVAMSARPAAVTDDGMELSVSVTLRGASAEFLVPVKLAVEQDQLTAYGSVVIHHSDFGVEPFSTMGGLLRVADELGIALEITARRM